jgi:Protein of unknown function (DUF1579)
MRRQRCVGWMVAAVAVGFLVGWSALAQEPPKPGPEHDILKQLEGTWDATVKFAGNESKGTQTYKMDLGGLWLLSKFDGTFGGQPFQGRGADSYDAKKQKYVGVWVDSMTTTPMLSEGTYDKEKKTLTMTSDHPGPDGKLAKHKMVSEWKDNDTIEWSMAVVGADGKDMPMMTISYKRKSK